MAPFSFDKMSIFEKSSSGRMDADKEALNPPTAEPLKTEKTGGRKSGPLFFHAFRSAAPRLARICESEAGHIQARQSPRGQRSKTLPAHRRGIATSGHAFDPALWPTAGNRPRLACGGPPSRRHHSHVIYQQQNTACALYSNGVK